MPFNELFTEVGAPIAILLIFMGGIFALLRKPVTNLFEAVTSLVRKQIEAVDEIKRTATNTSAILTEVRNDVKRVRRSLEKTTHSIED